MMKEKLVSLHIPSDATSLISLTPNDGVMVKSFCEEAKVPFMNQVKELALELWFSKKIGLPFEITVSFPGKYLAVTRQPVVPFKQ